MKRFLQKNIYCLLVFASIMSKAQVRFTASASPAKIGKDDYTELQFTVENAKEVQQILPPSLKDFIIISGPNQSSGFSSVNGAVKQYIAVSYTIKPKATGTFIIASAQAKADGINLKSNPVRVEVSAASAGTGNRGNNSAMPFAGFDPFEENRPSIVYSESVLRRGENAIEKIKQNIIVKAIADKTSCYVGEPVVVTYKLYTRLKSESNLTKNPSFNGFSVIDLMQPDNLHYTREQLNGKEFNVYTIRKSQLYPLQSGTLALESAVIDNNVHFIKEAYANKQFNAYGNRYDVFSETMLPPEAMEDHKVTLESKPISISVKPLPENNKPVNFKGAVGRFEIKSTIENETFTTDDVGKYLVLIEGQGNLQMVNTPDIIWPKELEVFEPKLTEDLNKLNVPVSGKKLIEFPFIITVPGNYTIPAITFDFFDPASGKYRSAVTRPVNFTVKKGTGKALNNPVSENSKEKFLNKLFYNRWILVSVIASLIIAGLLYWLFREIKRDKKNVDLSNAVPAAPEPKKIIEIEDAASLLKGTEEYLIQNNSKAFYDSLNSCLKNYLTNWLQLPSESLNKKNIAEQLDRKVVATETAIRFQQLLDEVEWQLYTPIADEDKMPVIFENARELLEVLNSYRIRYQ